jgi:hypothetical protein
LAQHLNFFIRVCVIYKSWIIFIVLSRLHKWFISYY